MKIALVHDYLSQDGGAEQVLRTFHHIWPEAPIFVLFNRPGSVPGFEDADVRESFLRWLPGARTRFQWYLPLMPMATENYNLREFDVVLSSTSAFAKGVLTRPDALHISYCHTPPRYLWTDTQEYVAELKYNRLVKAVLPRVLHNLRLWDKMSVDRVDYFIANSNVVRQRIQKYYRRESDIIYPPVLAKEYQPVEVSAVGDYYVTGGRLVYYKRFDLVIHVFNRLGWPLKIFGTGPHLAKLRAMAKPNIQFVGRVNEAEKAKLLAHARAFIHPQVEDLGITPLESMAAGRPVIAYGAGGVTETVVPGDTGLFFYEQNWESLLDTLVHFDYQAWDPAKIRARAERFDEDIFRDRIRNYVEEKYTLFKETQGNYQRSAGAYAAGN